VATPEDRAALQIEAETGLVVLNVTAPVGVPLEPVTSAVNVMVLPGESVVLLDGETIVTVAPPTPVLGYVTGVLVLIA
jgi:hypothetical protein